MEKVSRKYNNDVFIAGLILILPFFIYAHLLFSKYKSELIIFNYSFDHWLDNNETYIWIFLNDLVPFGLLLMMFFTTGKKWKFFLFPLQIFYLLAILRTLDIFPTLEKSFLSLEEIIISLLLVSSIIVFDFYIAKKYRHVASYVNLRSLIKHNYKLDIRLIQSNLSNLRAERYDLSKGHYFKKLFYLHLILDKNLKNIYNSINLVRSKGNSRIEKVLITLIILMTLLWFLPFLFPEGWTYMNFASWTIESHGFTDLRTFIWFITRKFIVVLFLSIWFITSEHWWKYAIFSPLIIFSYQFWEAFQDVSQLDAIGNIKVFPLVLINILLVAGISKWIKYRTDLLLIYKVIDKEVEGLLKELKGEQLNDLSKKYKEIKEGYSDKDIDYYKTKLKALEQELILKLDLMKG